MPSGIGRSIKKKFTVEIRNSNDSAGVSQSVHQEHQKHCYQPQESAARCSGNSSFCLPNFEDNSTNRKHFYLYHKIRLRFLANDVLLFNFYWSKKTNNSFSPFALQRSSSLRILNYWKLILARSSNQICK